ncbi:Cytochrome b561 and DOMON domain-containing protein [Rhynchospora pubera]|uniref:Cytochrome b561 and DOMON domain-containing protein n=2 Tax=Rhynchospora pubera TaxID=906938 RepID=A0AAV8EJX4_9POAL|nr:Cytochrome b561 and DOMON domain-containing protein [Rhynchospora pubera]
MFPLLFLIFLLHPKILITITEASRCTISTPLKTYEKCISLPTQGATLAWTYHAKNATLDLAFTGTFISPSGWVACGINPTSPSMTGTRALVAFSDPSTGSLIVLPFILDASVKLQSTPLVSRPLDISLLSSSVSSRSGIRDGDTIQIFFTIKLSPNRTRVNFVWNRGLYVQEYSPTIHPTAASDLASHAVIDIVSTASQTGPPISSNLRWIHGTLNCVSWGIILPVGVALARYLRPFTSLFGPTWFYVHATVQIIGFLAGTAGFAIGIIMGNASVGVTYGLHRSLGITTFVTGGLQSAALLFRPKTTNKYRKYWKSYHHFVGYSSIVLGVVNVFQGFEVMGLSGSYWKLSYCLVLSTFIGACIALEVNAWVVFCRRAEEEKVRREGGGEVSQNSNFGKGRVSY